MLPEKYLTYAFYRTSKYFILLVLAGNILNFNVILNRAQAIYQFYMFGRA